jgi:hypothetical protein
VQIKNISTIAAIIWLSGPLQSQADGQIGINYMTGHTTIPTVTRFENIPVDGWGLSLGLGLTEQLSWSIWLIRIIKFILM